VSAVTYPATYPADTRPDWIKAIPRARDAAASRDAWVADRVQRRAPRRYTDADRAHLTAHAEREWAKRHPALAKVLAGAVGA
jgi:hypothetical protein